MITGNMETPSAMPPRRRRNMRNTLIEELESKNKSFYLYRHSQIK